MDLETEYWNKLTIEFLLNIITLCTYPYKVLICGTFAEL